MPQRRASGPAPTTSKKGSSTSGHDQPTPPPKHHASSSTTLPLSTAGSTTPQQKVVQILVARLKAKLPYYSGLSLTALESDEAILQVILSLTSFVQENLDIIALALCELLDRLAKLAGEGTTTSLEVLQSQLFVLKVLGLAFANRAHGVPAQDSKPGTPLTGSGFHGLPVPLDDNCARYILSVMVLFMRQTSHGNESAPLMLPIKYTDILFRGFDNSVQDPYSLPSPSLPTMPSKLRNKRSFNSTTSSSNSNTAVPTYEKTHNTLLRTSSSLNVLIARHTAQIIHHISSTNWRVILMRLRNRIQFLTQSVEPIPSPESSADLHLLTCCQLTKSRLVQVLVELSSRLLDMKQDVRLAVLPTWRVAIWNWMSEFPSEFAESSRRRGALEGAPERLFDLIWASVWNNSQQSQQSQHVGHTERALWPLLTLLHALSPDRINPELTPLSDAVPSSSRKPKKEFSFYNEIFRYSSPSASPKSKGVGATAKDKDLAELALVCGLDLCRAAALLPAAPTSSSSSNNLRLLASDIAPSILNLMSPSPPQQQKAFWDRYDEIDIPLFSDVLIAIWHFCEMEDSLRFFEAWVEMERSDAVKAACALACLRLICASGEEGAPQQDVELVDQLGETLASRFRSIFTSTARQMPETDSFGNMKRAAPRPRSCAPASSLVTTMSNRETLLSTLLLVFRARWESFWFPGSNTQDARDFYLGGIMRILGDPGLGDPLRVSAGGTLQGTVQMALGATLGVDAPGQAGQVEKTISSMGDLISSILTVLARNLIASRTEKDQQTLSLTYIGQILRFYVGRWEQPQAHKIVYHPSRLPAFTLVEIALIITLTSHDPSMTQLAGQALRLISHAERNPDPRNLMNDTSSEQLNSSSRHPVFEQLGDPKTYTIPSRLALQKKVRRLLRVAREPLPVHVAIWEEGFFRWKDLSEKVVSWVEGRMDVPIARRADHAAYQQELRWQWQHLTLFLASLCGPLVGVGEESGGMPSQQSALQKQRTAHELSKGLADIIPARELPDHFRVLTDPSSLVDRFIADLTDLLVAEDVQIREIARDALGSELSPRLYGRLLGYLEGVVKDIEKGVTTGTGNWTDGYGLFLEQFLTVLTLLMENESLTSEDLMRIDVSSIMHSISLFVARFGPEIPIRTRLRFCTLAEGVSARVTQQLGLGALHYRKPWPHAGAEAGRDGGESGVEKGRLSTLDIICGWMVTTSGLDANAASLQGELNMACLRAIVKVLRQLRLEVGTGTGDEMLTSATRQFNKYMGSLLGSLEIIGEIAKSDSVSDFGSLHHRMRQSTREAELRELVITGLAHLVSSNTDLGFKQCLPMAYDPDSRKRVIFAHVFARVIGEGGAKFEDGLQGGGNTGGGLGSGVFDGQSKGKDNSMTQKLCDLIRGSDMVLTLAICETCSPSEVDLMITVLLNVFDTRSSLLTLLKLIIDREIAQTTNDGQFFRGNSFYTRFLSTFARIHGYNYLRSLMRPLLKSMENAPGGYELDPNKVGGEEQANKNKEHVETVATAFLDIIQASLRAMPAMIRELCAHIAQSVYAIWPDSKFVSLGAFIFLRFISPVIVTPELVDLVVPKRDSVTIRRGLMVIAKVIQNLANNIFFGKEIHMTVLNDFLKSNIANVTRFLSALHKWPPEEEGPIAIEDERLGTSCDDTDMVVLHRFFVKHADKIGKELLSSSKPFNDSDQAAANGKRAWDGLCTLLVDLGPPLDTPRPSVQTSEQHREAQELLQIPRAQIPESVTKLFSKCPTPEDQNGLFVFKAAALDADALDLPMGMAYYLQMLLTEGQPHEIIYDFTSFSPTTEIPLQWIKYCVELIPADISSKLTATHLLNVNSATLKFLRRVYNISGGVQSIGAVRTYSSMRELLEQINLDDAGLEHLREPLILEQEESEMFTDVSLKEHHLPTPVHLIIGKTHLRITHIKSQQLGTGVRCRPTEIIPLGDISDVYSVSTGTDTNEFIIRRTRQAGTIYFNSPAREIIVKAIRTAKGTLRETKVPLADRFSRFGNVPATLMHVGLLNLDPLDDEVRGAAYHLLGQLCVFLNYDKVPITAVQAGFIPGVASTFAVFYSNLMAENSPHLTLDFISEVATGMQSMERDKFSERVACLQYMSPWIRHLSLFADPLNVLFERSGSRIRDCVRQLCEVAVTYPELSSSMNTFVWADVAKLDPAVLDTIIDELVRTAADGGVGTRRCEAVCLIMSSLSSIHVRSRVLNKLRKALNKTAPRQFKSFVEAPTWNEISTLIRLVLSCGNETRHAANNQMFVPEIVHITALLAGVGSTLIRKSIYGVLINLLQALWATHNDDGTMGELTQLITDAQKESVLRIYGLSRLSVTSEYGTWEPSTDRGWIENQENLTRFLSRVMETVSGSQGLLNVWRARWMSLVTSTAFQLSPAIQMRSFTTIGLLATSEVDEDFLYQMLVAFKTALSGAPESDTVTVVAMLRCIVRVVPALPDPSRYPCQLFWLGVALLQSSYFAFFSEAADLVRVTLEVMDSRQEIATDPSWMETWLWAGRENLDEVSSQLDQLLGLSFEPMEGRGETGIMGWSLAALLIKGLRQPALAGVAKDTLQSLLKIAVQIHSRAEDNANGHERVTIPPLTVPYFIALIPTCVTTTTYRELLQVCGVDPTPYLGLYDELDEAAENAIPFVTAAPLGLTDGTSALFCASLIGSMVSTAQGDDAESDMLFAMLSDIAEGWGDEVGMIYDSLHERITKTFGSSSNASVLRSVSSLFRYSSTPFPASVSSSFGKHGSASTLGTIPEDTGPSARHLNALEEFNMPGLAMPLGFVNTALSGANAETGRRSWEACMNSIVPDLVGLMIA